MIEELVDDGNNTKVTQDNKMEYVQLYSDYYLNKHCLKQFAAFKKGFNKVVNGAMIHVIFWNNVAFRTLTTGANYLWKS